LLLGSIDFLFWHSLVGGGDPDPHRSPLDPHLYWGIRIRIQEQENCAKLTIKPEFQPFKKALVPPKEEETFQEKVKLLSDQNPDQDRSALVWLPGSESGSALR
jgi:hypothetical protein